MEQRSSISLKTKSLKKNHHLNSYVHTGEQKYQWEVVGINTHVVVREINSHNSVRSSQENLWLQTPETCKINERNVMTDIDIFKFIHTKSSYLVTMYCSSSQT